MPHEILPPETLAICMVEILRRARSKGLNLNDALSLMVLCTEARAMRVCEVGACIGSTHGAVYKNLDVLENLGFASSNRESRPYQFWATRPGVEFCLDLLKHQPAAA